MTSVLGISAYYHDSAAALLVDGRIVAAAQEERFTRKKHDAAFPAQAIDYCLHEAGIDASDLDYVGFYEKPLLKFDRLLESYLAFAPRGLHSFIRAMPAWLREKLHLPRELRRGLGGKFRKRFVFAEHHESHAASAFFPSPFESAAILTMDGVGEWATSSFGVGQGNRIELTHQLQFPHSLGLLYSAVTYYCGFRVNSGEYKLMGLAPYGDPVYVDTLLKHVVDLKDDGSFRLDMRYFSYPYGLRMTSPKFHRLFGRMPRRPESPIDELDMNLAASIQKVTEEVVLRTARHIQRVTRERHLCLAGGVALNCVANGRLLREGPFEKIWIQPAAGDAGGALGVASLIWHQLLEQPRQVIDSNSQEGVLLGPRYAPEECIDYVQSQRLPYQQFESEQMLCAWIASQLKAQKVVAVMQGRMEFGPRALGARSILADPRDPTMQRQLNLKIKHRESFRPFAPIVLRERASEYFDLAAAVDSPYMLLVAGVKGAEVQQTNATNHRSLDPGWQRRQAIKSDIPAVTHVDGSARIQTVDAKEQPFLHQILQQFNLQTGCPVLINTSFNVRGEPLVCSPQDAVRCFLNTDIDVLILENIALVKADQPLFTERERAAYRSQFQLD
ncbi:MAG: carbamoyltransferase [Planctomycetales bacterium]|nr:carbamoyltransferase [Planctomycetales bacterium]